MVEKLREAAKKLEEYNKKFEDWASTFDKIIRILNGDYITLQAVLEVTPKGDVKVIRIELPSYVLYTSENLEGVPITEFTVAALRGYIMDNINRIISSFIDDLARYAGTVREEIKNLTLNVNDIIKKIKCEEENEKKEEDKEEEEKDEEEEE